MNSSSRFNKRILIVDDNKDIHKDFEKILRPRVNANVSEIDSLEKELFNDSDTSKPSEHIEVEYDLDFASHGDQAIEMCKTACEIGQSYAMAFMDVRMPPGTDGIEAIQQIWKNDPHVIMVVCTAFSDYSWEDMLDKLGHTDKVLFLRKPFDTVAVKQMALTLLNKWNLDHNSRNYVEDLKEAVTKRTEQLKENNKQLTETNSNLQLAKQEEQKQAKRIR
jgi:CheY-like chemotaxis protein